MDSEEMWRIARHEIRQAMERKRISNAQLAFLIGGGISEDKVYNWRSRTPIPLHHLVRIAQVLHLGADGSTTADPGYLFMKMGLIADTNESDVYALAYRLQRLRSRMDETLGRLGSQSRAYGAQLILDAAIRDGAWSVEFKRSFEGPHDCRIHVADHLTVRKADGSQTTEEAISGDEELSRALWAAHALRDSARAPQSGPNDDWSRWSIPHVGSPMSPSARSTHPMVPSVCCYSITPLTLTNSIAHFLALALGYGLTTTRLLAFEAEGPVSAPTARRARSTAHRVLLESPPARRVWAHSSLPDEITPNPLAAPSDVPVVWLREDDSLLEAYARTPGAPRLHTLHARRDEVANAAAQADRVFTVTQTALDGTDRWQQALNATLQVLNELRTHSFLSSTVDRQWPSAMRGDPALAGPVLRWLQRRMTGTHLEPQPLT
ncbi:hypothetical protein [Microbacterium sp.]|uniref:hypothetical protein n=1 Tax=Microbacterium sp. TaxID=51671 RepID=UPI003A85121D